MNKSSCSPALSIALLSAYALFGCAVYDKCGLPGCPGDSKITQDVEASLNQHPELGAPNGIHVQTRNHVVYLSGKVSEGLMRETAEAIARHTNGVTEVEDDIYVSR